MITVYLCLFECIMYVLDEIGLYRVLNMVIGVSIEVVVDSMC